MQKLKRLKKLIVVLSFILVVLMFGLVTVLQNTVVIRGQTTAFLTSYSLGKVRTKQLSTAKDQNLIQGSSTQTRHRKLSSSLCAAEPAPDFPEPVDDLPFWVSLDDGFDTHVRPTAFFDVRRVENDVALPAIKILAMSRNRNLSETVFCSIPSSDSVIYSIQAKASQVWIPSWNLNASSGQFSSLSLILNPI